MYRGAGYKTLLLAVFTPKWLVIRPFRARSYNQPPCKFYFKVVESYTRGLCWVLAYYFQGCVDWGWYYPFHYAPFASDFTDLGSIEINWDRDAKPRKPLEQLMCVFPAASGQFLPDTWRTLMSDPFSPIIDFYPTDFAVDLNGKKFEWMGVALLIGFKILIFHFFIFLFSRFSIKNLN